MSFFKKSIHLCNFYGKNLLHNNFKQNWKKNKVLLALPRLFSSSIEVGSEAPLVADSMIKLTVIDFHGNRHVITGRIGQTLMQACEVNNIDFIEDDSNGGGNPVSVKRSDDFREDLFGEGASSSLSHVIVSNEWFPKLDEPTDQELNLLESLPDGDRAKTSRLATEIILTKDLHGLVVVVPETPPIERHCYTNNDENW